MAGRSDGSDLRDLIDLIRRNVWTLVAAAALGVGVAAYSTHGERPQYRAEAAVRITNARRALTGGLGDAAIEQGRLGGDPLLTHIQILQSRAIAGQVVDREGLRVSSVTPGAPSSVLRDLTVSASAGSGVLALDFSPDRYSARWGGAVVSSAYGQTAELAGLRFTVTEPPSGVEEALFNVVARDVAVRKFRELFHARARDRTDVIDLEYTDPDPARAQSVVNTVVAVFQSGNLQDAQRESRRRREFLSEQLAQTDADLAGAQLALSKFRTREQLYSSRDRFSSEQAELMQLQLRRSELEADRNMYRSLLSRLENDTPQQRAESIRTLISAPGIASNPVVSGMYAQLMAYERELESLTSGVWRRSETHPDVQRLRQLVVTTTSQLLDAVENHLAFLDARLSALDEMELQRTQTMQQLPQQEVEEVQLAQQVQTLQRMSDQLREEFQRARISEAVQTGQVEVVDLAALPAYPVGSGRARKILFGLVIGLLLGVGASYVRERLDTAIHHEEQVASVLQVPSLAIIPQIAPNGDDGRRLRIPVFHTAWQRLGPSTKHELVTLAHRRSSGAEAYRTLRTNLIFSQAIGSLKTLVITSALEGEGKTTTAANLAVALAQQGTRVLIVDGDLRRARLHRVFNQPLKPGLSEVLANNAAAGDAIRGTSTPGLYLLPAGTLPPNPSELLGGGRMRRLLEALEKKFETVILDSPPLFTASDAAVLGSQVDGVLLVVRAGRTHREVGRHAVQQLMNVGARIVGAVLNDPDADVPRYSSAATQYYREYYGEKV